MSRSKGITRLEDAEKRAAEKISRTYESGNVRILDETLYEESP
jgi:hypothetical protein